MIMFPHDHNNLFVNERWRENCYGPSRISTCSGAPCRWLLLYRYCPISTSGLRALISWKLHAFLHNNRHICSTSFTLYNFSVCFRYMWISLLSKIINILMTMFMHNLDDLVLNGGESGAAPGTSLHAYPPAPGPLTAAPLVVPVATNLYHWLTEPWRRKYWT